MEHLKPRIENQGLIIVSQRIVYWLKYILALLIIAEILLTCVNIVGSFDFPWQFAEGNFILGHGYAERSVLNAYGEISPQFENEYILYELLIAGINRFAGWLGLCLFFGLVCLFIYGPCLVAFLKSRSRFVLIDVILFALAQFLIDIRLSARPELIADVCYVMAGIMLMRQTGPIWSSAQVLALGLIYCLWANAHGTFLIGIAMLGLWYIQLFLCHWRSLLFSRDLRWMLPGIAAIIGCTINPFGLYRLIQPFKLHSLIWGQGTSLEMAPVTSGVALLPITWTCAAIIVLLMRVRERKYYWLMAMLLLLQYMTFVSFRYNLFIGLTLLIITWDGLTHPRESFSPPFLPLLFGLTRLGVYFGLVLVFLNINQSLLISKIGMIRDYCRYVYPMSRIATSSSFNWLREHPKEDYFLLSYLAAGSWSQMPGTHGIHPLIDSGTHRYSDRTNQLYYYACSSPKTFDLILAKLKINAIAVNSFNIYWAPALNANPDWQLAQIENDSQLYLRRGKKSTDIDPGLFAKWDEAAEKAQGSPSNVSVITIMRGLKLRPDAKSLAMLTAGSDVAWAADPQIVYFTDWLDQVPDIEVGEALSQIGAKMDNSSAGLRIIFLFHLKRFSEAAEVARNWHPRLLNMGYQDLEMLRADAFIQVGDLKAARKILDSFWPQPRYSLRWARLCRQVYTDQPDSLPKNARLLSGLADQFDWQEALITTLNNNISQLTRVSP